MIMARSKHFIIHGKLVCCKVPFKGGDGKWIKKFLLLPEPVLSVYEGSRENATNSA
jgi:hypothetical protein